MGFVEGLSKWIMQHVFGRDAVEHKPLAIMEIDPDRPYIISDGPISFLPLVASQYTKITRANFEWESVTHAADVKDWSHGILIGVLGCARCGQDHPDDHPLAFMPFDRPVMDEDGIWTHWAICPNTGDPVLLRNVPVPVRCCETCEFWDKFPFTPHADGTRWSYCRRPFNPLSTMQLPDSGSLHTRADFLCSEYRAIQPEKGE